MADNTKVVTSLPPGATKIPLSGFEDYYQLPDGSVVKYQPATPTTTTPTTTTPNVPAAAPLTATEPGTKVVTSLPPGAMKNPWNLGGLDDYYELPDGSVVKYQPAGAPATPPTTPDVPITPTTPTVPPVRPPAITPGVTVEPPPAVIPKVPTAPPVTPGVTVEPPPAVVPSTPTRLNSSLAGQLGLAQGQDLADYMRAMQVAYQPTGNPNYQFTRNPSAATALMPWSSTLPKEQLPGPGQQTPGLNDLLAAKAAGQTGPGVVPTVNAQAGGK